MLDQETKKKIDDCRDILVGKLPDPKSQVEQITIALIYKFMDDMDKESEEWGGKATFFKGDYKKYAWSKIFDPRMSGHEMTALYGEAIERMDHNRNIPQLFRDIFKNAYLPYRDPETLKSFLKEINEFTYEHSEQLGDAFEYLLSSMDSQGEAGQFRTPRHIIDFIVEIVDPKKNDIVLDPACGTAGFLISSYKHILKANTKKRAGDKLTPDERKRLINNFMGYDISPDMVRLSLVNLYLHGFSNPKITEYDTLTSEENWNDTADVILANPPFMSPKGGIRPHKRFSIKAKRSEVLFVDYIAEHLNPNGRGGVIVPEGIIFQSQTAYKKLRKMLIEDYLWAVVSLPAGVFNPYSGVKTSVLLMDKSLAKKTNKILFVKIENDGYDLGAQRTPIDKNDFPRALKFIIDYKKTIRTGKDIEYTEFAHAVEKTKIAESGDWNLSGARYLDTQQLNNDKFEWFKLGDICDIYNGSTPSRKEKSYWKSGTIPWFTVDDIREQGREILYTKQFVTEKALSETSVKLLPKNTVLLCCTASVGEYAFSNIELTTNQQFNGLVVKKEFREKLFPKYLFITSSNFKSELIRLSGKTSFNFVSVGVLKKLSIPLPPLDIQEAIASEIDNYQKIIDGAKQVVDNYKPTIKIDPEWEMVELADLSIQILSGGTPSTKISEYWKGDIPWITSADILNLKEVQIRKHITQKAIKESATNLIPKDNIIVVTRVGLGKLLLNNFDVCISQDSQGIIINKEKVIPKFLLYVLFDRVQKFKETSRGTTIQGVTKGQLEKIQIPLPTKPKQKEIVTQIEAEQEMVNANKKLIQIYEQKIKDRISEVWGE